MTEKLSMSSLYDKLSQLGFNQDYIENNALPSWWSDELNDKPTAVLEGAGYISENFNLELKSLLREESIRFNPPPKTKFKGQHSSDTDYFNAARALASRVAELIACSTVDIDFIPLPTDVKEIRAEILVNSPKINLDSLLQYCWDKGIVVGYFNNFPEKIKKFAGFVQRQASSPVIILSSSRKESGILTFDLAHELGHLALGHLEEGILIDEKILSDNESRLESSNDAEENEANKFAADLLLGNCVEDLANKTMNSVQHLVNWANKKVKENPTVGLDSVILNYAWHSGDWGRSHSALKQLSLDISNDQQTINSYLADRLNWDNFNDETYEYLEKALGV